MMIKYQKIILEWEAAKGSYNNMAGRRVPAPSQEDKNS